jgi:thioredoxin:protein disulfide reductase
VIAIASTLLLLALAQSPPPAPGLIDENPVKVEAFLSVDRVRPGDTFDVAVVFTLAEPYHIYGADEPNYIATKVTPAPVKGISWEAPRYPASVEKKTKDETLRLYEKRAVVVFTGHASESLVAADVSTTVSVDYQSCTSESCLPPRKGVPIALKIPVAAKGADAHPANAELFAGAQQSAESGGGFGDILAKQGLWAGLLILLLGGIVTAFTPCVLPMIPFTVAFFTNQVDRSKTKTLVLALVYTLGIVTTFSILGWLFGRAGSSAGAILGNKWVVIAFIAIFVALGLSCFGLFELTIPAPIMAKLGGGSRRGTTGAFVMGSLLGVVAAPCVGPVLAALLLYIAHQGSGLSGLLFMAVFGLGLGLPFIALAFASGSIPKAGAWMVWVKEIFGVLIFGTALWYLSTLVDSPRLVTTLAGIGLVLLALRYAVPALRRTESEHKSIVLGAVALLLAIGFFLPQAPRIVFHESSIHWRTDHDAALAEARRDGRPALVDFTAKWCFSCKEMEHMMEEPEVAAALERFVMITVDCTEDDGPGVKLRTERYGKYELNGVPASAYYNSKGKLVATHFGELKKAEFLELVRSVETREPLEDQPANPVAAERASK